MACTRLLPFALVTIPVTLFAVQADDKVHRKVTMIRRDHSVRSSVSRDNGRL